MMFEEQIISLRDRAGRCALHLTVATDNLTGKFYFRVNLELCKYVGYPNVHSFISLHRLQEYKTEQLLFDPATECLYQQHGNSIVLIRDLSNELDPAKAKRIVKHQTNVPNTDEQEPAAEVPAGL